MAALLRHAHGMPTTLFLGGISIKFAAKEGQRMARVKKELRAAIAANIREQREKIFPGRGGSRKCAEAFGVTPQRWSPWENGSRSPDEASLQKIASFFGVTSNDLRRLPPPPPAPLPPAVSGCSCYGEGMNELMDVYALLSRSYGECAAGLRTPPQFAAMLKEIHRYAKYVLGEARNRESEPSPELTTHP